MNKEKGDGRISTDSIHETRIFHAKCACIPNTGYMYTQSPPWLRRLLLLPRGTLGSGCHRSGPAAKQTNKNKKTTTNGVDTGAKELRRDKRHVRIIARQAQGKEKEKGDKTGRKSSRHRD